jgi:metal-sulfur cluster biosynthetic enzyme
MAAPVDRPVSLAQLLGVTVSHHQLLERLAGVIDPELGLGIVDLGLVYEAEVVEGIARILMTTTTPACPIGTYLTDSIRDALFDLDGILDVEIELTYEPRWSPDLMSDSAKRMLGWS